ncbi:MAG: Lpg1974 family pore-forming outer membrane protein [Gammaproteobacteria bacterium]|nr:Lpg1974 family pore-forming outer membrane protein [Gammaproteobacteria bacterium]
MLKLKTTAVAVLALGSSAVFAGTMGPVCAPGNVTIPCERTAWDVGAQALYLNPTYSNDLGYVNTITTAGVGSQLQTVNPSWGWGFEVEGSYHFNTGNDLNLNWYHLNNGNNRTFNAAGTVSFAGNTITPTGAFSVDPKWDAVNLELGQHIDFSDMKSMRIHAGVEYARLNTSINTNYTVSGVAGAQSDSMTYNGFGPRLGGDLNYGIGNGFSIYGNGAGALLIGSAKRSITGNTVTPATNNLSFSKTTMVPELEAKLGAMYDFSMAQGDLGLDVGYMWVNYFDTQDGMGSYGLENSNFALNGLYFGLKWVGNV